jgi:glutathione S-transferase
MTYVLHIGDTPYSSWSLRGWLLLHAFGLPFETRLHRMYDPAFDAYRAAQAPARTVPLLDWGESGRTARVWDSLAIAETLAERHPEAGHWPAAPESRGAARSMAAEMHAGFAALRQAAPMNVRRDGPALAPSDAVRADLARLCALWGWALDRFGGPWLSGADFCAADAFYAPVAFRIRGYRLPVAGAAEAYAQRLLDHPSVAAWEAQARADPRRIPFYESI